MVKNKFIAEVTFNLICLTISWIRLIFIFGSITTNYNKCEEVDCWIRVASEKLNCSTISVETYWHLLCMFIISDTCTDWFFTLSCLNVNDLAPQSRNHFEIEVTALGFKSTTSSFRGQGFEFHCRKLL